MNWYTYVQSKPERILCAAILRKEPKICKPYHEGINDICKIEIGYRHHDIMRRFSNELNTNPYAQGFYTSKGRFVGRYEAMYIAYKSGLIPSNIAWENPNDSEKSFVDFMNDMIIGEIKEDNFDGLELIKQREKIYKNLGYKQLFSEDLY